MTGTRDASTGYAVKGEIRIGDKVIMAGYAAFCGKNPSVRRETISRVLNIQRGVILFGTMVYSFCYRSIVFSIPAFVAMRFHSTESLGAGTETYAFGRITNRITMFINPVMRYMFSFVSDFWCKLPGKFLFEKVLFCSVESVYLVLSMTRCPNGGVDDNLVLMRDLSVVP